MRTMRRLFCLVAAAAVLCAAGATAQNTPEANVASRDFIKSWLLCGPFPNPLAKGVTEYRHDETTLGFYADYLAPVGGEQAVQPKEGLAVMCGDGAQRVWQQYASPEDYIDFCKVYSDNQNGKVAYAACWLSSEVDQEILLGLGSNDGVRVWVNGVMIWDNHCARGAEADQDLVAVPVKQGANLLLLKIDQGVGKWGFYARVVNRDDKVAELMQETHPKLDVTYTKEKGALSVWMGRTSKYRVLRPLPEVKATLRKADGEAAAAVSCPLGEATRFDTASLPAGPYWVCCSVALPEGRSAQGEKFYLHGESPVKLYTYTADAKPASLRVEMLQDRRKACAKDEAQYAALGDWPELEPVKDGLAETDEGQWQMQRTDISPFWLRVLLDAPGLGHQWYMVNDEPFTLRPGETKELDVLAKAELALRMRISSFLEKGMPMSEWIYQNISARLSATPFRPGGKKPDELYHSLHAMSSMKSLLAASDTLTAWFAPSLEKVGQDEPIPAIQAGQPQITLAKNEYESFQVVLTPSADISGVTVSITPPKTPENLFIDPANISINLVEYVDVQQPSDYYGAAGLWPDPLPPLTGPINLQAGKNQPLWITVYAPKNLLPGTYTGNVVLKTAGETLGEIPFDVVVCNVTLPPDTHTRTAYGVSPDFSWHGPLTQNQKVQVFDLYMQLCATHRISPYNPDALAPIDLRFEGTPPRPVIDFAAFDAAMTRYLNEFHFTSFNLGGLPADLAGFPRYSPEYNQLFAAAYEQVQKHLYEKGWLGKAYWYWVDEPPPSQYEEVKKGMDLLQTACPYARRLLTCNQEDAPVPYFYNSVNLWVPILDKYDPERAGARQDRGEEIWWYVCTGPKAPYANNFIDHPAINHRIRYWQMDRFDVDGDLYWSATYWAQNPWEQAMSISDSGGPWGNGDGRLLYPPRRTKPAEAVLDPPVVSIRFENLRDGLEDREFLYMLEQAAAQRSGAGRSARAVLAQARNILSPSLTCYEQNPLVFYLLRYQVMQEAAALSTGN